jgi:hypothetical protein
MRRIVDGDLVRDATPLLLGLASIIAGCWVMLSPEVDADTKDRFLTFVAVPMGGALGLGQLGRFSQSAIISRPSVPPVPPMPRDR